MKIIHEEVDGIYGYRRMKININRRLGKNYNHKRIYRLMKVAGIESVIRRKKSKYKRSKPEHIADNILNREFSAEKPNKKWVTDVTEFKYGSFKKMYLSAILDLYDGSVISYVLGRANNNSLVFQTFEQAIQLLDEDYLNNDNISDEDRLLIHSDRGYQYTSNGFKKLIDKANMRHSMSRVGKCIDNGPMEAFWGTLKCEKYYLNKFATFEDLKAAIDDYIHFYNHERYQEKLNGLSPAEYRAKTS
jgi:putative transposase